MKLAAVITLLIVIFLGLGLYLRLKKPAPSPTVSPSSAPSAPVTNQSPLTIAAMQQKSYPGSNITIEQTLTPGAIYNQYIVSYQSEGLKQFALLTVPQGQKPNGGWPVIIFNHGYIPPAQYSTAESYAVMVEPLASAGYIVFKPDYRGNGSSQGKPEQPYISPSYVTDSMNALASIKKYPDADPNKIGVFGHSMGGNVTLHELVVTHDFKAAEIISGVVGNETDILNWWNQRFAAQTITGNDLDTYYAIQQIIKERGLPKENPTFWNAIDPTQFITDITTPIQIQVGSADDTVPPNFSSSLSGKLKSSSKNVDYIEYPGADHNLTPSLSQVMSQAISFFDKYLK